VYLDGNALPRRSLLLTPARLLFCWRSAVSLKHVSFRFACFLRAAYQGIRLLSPASIRPGIVRDYIAEEHPANSSHPASSPAPICFALRMTGIARAYRVRSRRNDGFGTAQIILASVLADCRRKPVWKGLYKVEVVTTALPDACTRHPRGRPNQSRSLHPVGCLSQSP
jgi:hypothetical protein